ncbi:hypothetical protein ACXR2T_10165 [Leucobacter sp. HY1910]
MSSERDAMPARVQYLTGPGDDLLLTEDLDELVQRVGKFITDSVLPHDDIAVHPVVSIPLPVTAQRDGARKRLRYDPSLAWHPLFWLPLPVGLRLRVQETDEPQLRPETTAEWAVRVLVQVEEAGLYDSSTGTWLDVLATVGLDRNDHAVHERVHAWQRGAPDAALDRIDLSDRFISSSSDIAAQVIPQIHDLLHAQWLNTSRTINAQLIEIDQIKDIDIFQRAVRRWLHFASLGLLGAPGAERLDEALDRLSVWSDPEAELDLLREVVADVLNIVAHHGAQAAA